MKTGFGENWVNEDFQIGAGFRGVDELKQNDYLDSTKTGVQPSWDI